MRRRRIAVEDGADFRLVQAMPDFDECPGCDDGQRMHYDVPAENFGCSYGPCEHVHHVYECVDCGATEAW